MKHLCHLEVFQDIPFLKKLFECVEATVLHIAHNDDDDEYGEDKDIPNDDDEYAVGFGGVDKPLEEGKEECGTLSAAPT
jgi:hypothetical protein